MTAGRGEGAGRLVETVQVVGVAALGLGASVARLIAEGLSGRPQPTPPGETTLGGIARNGTTALGSLMAMTVAAARDAGLGLGKVAPTDARPAAPQPAGPPRVLPGTSLRVPLSIENPAAEGRMEIEPYALGATQDGRDRAAPFTLDFQPATLGIGPRDFEKLVVTIAVPADMPSGRWTALFALGPGSPDPNAITFVVPPPDA